MNNPKKKKFRSLDAERKRKKKQNSRIRSTEYIQRKKAKRSLRSAKMADDEQNLSLYTNDYLSDRKDSVIDEGIIKDRRSKRLEQMKTNITNRRSEQEYRNKELEKNRKYKEYKQIQLKSDSERMYSKVRDDYFNAIKEGPVFKCDSCSGRFFRKSVYLTNKSEIIKSIGIEEAIRVFVPFTDELMLCHTCNNQLKRGLIPKLCTHDGLELEPIPDILKLCNTVEERLCSPIIPFEQIRTLGFYGKQRGLKGNVVNVPIDLPKTVQSLPRRLEDCHTIQIKFKRMVTHKSDYLHERIRPARVWNAIKYLSEKPLFKKHNIEINLEWMNTYGLEELDFVVNSEDKDFFNKESVEESNIGECETQSNISDTTEIVDDIGEESTSSDEEFTEVNEVNNSGGSETMLQCKTNNGLILAPGEGNKPISFYSVDCEYLAFPKLYCGNAFNEENRKNLSICDLSKYKLRYFDRRFAESTQSLFFLLRQKQVDNLRRAINLVLKKRESNRKELSVGDILDKQTIDYLIRNDEAYNTLSQDRTSPAYWEKKMKELMAMIRQLGVPTFFLTLSAAESQWNELICVLEKISSGKDITEDMAKIMNIDDKYRLIKNDPVTCAQYFDHKFREILKVLKHSCGPFAPFKLIDYFVRVEFQHRGSPHVHCLLWLENAPNITNSDDFTAVELFIDQYIVCESDGSEDLSELVKLQNHRHSKSCRRKRNEVKVCRFGIPFFPMRSTRILSPFTDEENRETQHLDFESIHNAIRDKIYEIDEKIRKKDDSIQKFSFDDFINDIGLTDEMYLLTIRSTLTKKTVFIRRNPKDIRCNGFNSEILRLFRSNMDIQFIVDPYGCVHYIVNYISKSYRGVSKLIRDAIAETRKGYMDNVRRLKLIGQVFLNGSEVSAQEAVYILLSMQLTYNSRPCLFINTGERDKRTKIIKRKSELLKLDPESTDIMATGLIDYYINRPDELNDVCLADFAANYQMTNSSKWYNENEVDQECFDDVEQNIPANQRVKYRVRDPQNPNKILCTLVKRLKSKVIRYVRYNKNN